MVSKNSEKKLTDKLLTWSIQAVLVLGSFIFVDIWDTVKDTEKRQISQEINQTREITTIKTKQNYLERRADSLEAEDTSFRSIIHVHDGRINRLENKIFPVK